MTDRLRKRDAVAWKRALSQYKAAEEARLRLDHKVESPEWIIASERHLSTQSALMRLKAPTGEAVFEKLIVLFLSEFWSGEEEFDHQNFIIKDLIRLRKSRRIGKISKIPSGWLG